MKIVKLIVTATIAAAVGAAAAVLAKELVG